MNLVELKKGELYVPEDFAKNHNYYADELGEKKYTGITTVLGVLAKPALIQWAADEAVKHIKETGHSLVAESTDTGKSVPFWVVPLGALEEARTAHARKKEKAGEHGTDAHALVETWINLCLENNFGNPIELEGTSLVPSPIEPFIRWAWENVDHFLFSERRMSNKELFLAGTADFACVMKDGKKVMGDFKTSSGIYGIDYWLQVAAYRLLAEGEGDEPYDGAVIVRLGKKGPSDFEVQYLYEYETFRDAFLSCLQIYRAQAAIKGLTIH